MGDDLQSKAAEMMKKVLTVGVGTLFLTEESLRTMISEFKLPKELLAAVLDSAQRTKGDFLKGLTKEIMAHVMERVNLVELAEELLSRYEVELKVHVNFKKKSEEPKS